MAKAIWNGTILAESHETIIIEGNHYFPPDSVKTDYFQESAQTTICSWKGAANYYDIVVNGDRNPSAAWYYAKPMAAASEIAGYVAFWNGVHIEA